MMLEPERVASVVAERLRRPVYEDAPARERELEPRQIAAADRVPPGGRAWVVQRTLEELGIHCQLNDSLQDLKGFFIASPRGAEIVVSKRLGPDERLAVYVHLLAHALLEEAPQAAKSGFFSRLEYVEGREPGHRSVAERREEMVAHALAQVILSGCLEHAPQYTYRRTPEPARSHGLRPMLGRLVLEICHRTSLMLFWYSPKYQKLRSRPQTAQLIRHLEQLLRTTYAC